MKKKIFTMVAAVALLFGMTSCGNEDNPTPSPTPTPVDLSSELVGFWYDEFDYSDKTEDGTAFSHVMLAVRVDEDETGCIYLGLFDGASEDPLAVYGGFDDAGFSWKLLDDGSIELGDPVTGETYSLARTRADGGNYANNMTDVSKSNMNYSNNQLTVNNANYNGTLNKANETKAEQIEQKLSTKIKSNVSLTSGGKAPIGFGEGDIR